MTSPKLIWKLFAWRGWPLAVKLGLAMTLLVSATVGSVTAVAIIREQRIAHGEMEA